jgi:predicted PurR-regulated permease PerM
VVVICALDLGREVLVPITLAVLLSFLVAPLVDLLRRLHLGQLPSVVIAVVLALAVMGGIGTLIGAQVAQLGADLPHYQAAIEKKIQRVQGATVGRADDLLRSASTLFKRATPPSKPESGVGPGGTRREDKVPLPVAVQEPPLTPKRGSGIDNARRT